jgi:hypothetical protein
MKKKLEDSDGRRKVKRRALNIKENLDKKSSSRSRKKRGRAKGK